MLLFDLDDTLINTHLRHYKVVESFFTSHDKSFIGFEEYVKIRRNKGLSNSSVVKEFEPVLSEAFREYWYKCIEREDYLQYDTAIVAKDLLMQLKYQNYILGIVSLRSNSTTAISQLQTFEWYSYFNAVHFLSHSSEMNPKIEMVKKLSTQYKIAGLVGDAETDRQAAEETDILFYGVKTGLYNSDLAYRYSDVNEVISSFLKK